MLSASLSIFDNLLLPFLHFQHLRYDVIVPRSRGAERRRSRFRGSLSATDKVRPDALTRM